jgi:hypothetical protein
VACLNSSLREVQVCPLHPRLITFVTSNVQHRRNRRRWRNRHLFQGGAQHRSLLLRLVHPLCRPHLPGGRRRRHGPRQHRHRRALRAYRLVCRHPVRQPSHLPFRQPRHSQLQRALRGGPYPPLRGLVLNYVLLLRYPHGGNLPRLSHSQHLSRRLRFRQYRLVASQLLLSCLREGHQSRQGGRPRLPHQQGPCRLRPLASGLHPLHEECREDMVVFLHLHHHRRLSCPFALGQHRRASRGPFKQVFRPDEV